MSLDQLLPVLIYVIVAAHADQQQQRGGGRLELIPLGEKARLTGMSTADQLSKQAGCWALVCRPI